MSTPPPTYWSCCDHCEQNRLEAGCGPHLEPCPEPGCQT